ncbi:MAG: hypothetical protein A2051_00170 [Desulfovibrionales bacterium GWA2_65_9]|nr:MAG: hypothetical protein A2051_00170 [Desulfovibrionales bacterium GWA2_65_9]
MPAQTLFLATDIFGHTPELQALARDIGGRVRILSPYGDERPRFASEVEAYAAFMARTSVENYAEEVAQALANASPALAVGFSVGATALWLALARTGGPGVRSSVLYYGSRIREHQGLRPGGDVRLVFAATEAAFDPAELVAELRAQGLAAETLPGTAHGFMNRLSAGFDACVYDSEIKRLRGLLA